MRERRKEDEYREIKVEKGVVKLAEGSARVSIGDTQVIAGVKIEKVQPYPDTPDEGVLIVNAELLPLASPTFMPGPPDERAIELARVVDRGIRESKAIDIKKLCIKKGERVWGVMIDIDVLDHDGNLIDASSLAAIAALLNAEIVEFSKGKMKRKSKGKLPVKKIPISCTFAKTPDGIVLDPSIEEEEKMACRLTITTTDKEVCAMQKGGEGTFTTDEVFNMIEVAQKRGKELRKMLK